MGRRLITILAVLMLIVLGSCSNNMLELIQEKIAEDRDSSLPIDHTRIYTNDYHTAALKSDTTVWTWGHNSHSELGDGTIVDSNIPIQVTGLSEVSSVAPGGLFTAVLKSDGTVWAWGDNNSGELGNGTITTVPNPTPAMVTDLPGIVSVAAGYDYAAALENDGDVYTWGNNDFGQLGNGDSGTSNPDPVKVAGVSEVVAVSACMEYTVALKNDGTVWTWGANSHIPVQVLGFSEIVAIDVGYIHIVALKSDGTVWAWGNNSYGQLGDGTTISKSIPVQVLGLSGVAAITAGWHHSMALKSDGTVWAWGDNSSGKLGDSTTTERHVPVQVSGISGIVAITAGQNHSVTLKGDGTVWAWGNNSDGQLGDGTNTTSYTPVQVVNLNLF